MQTPDRLMTTIDVEEFTGYGRMTIMHAINSGHLKAYRPEGTRRWRYFQDDVIAWITQNPTETEETRTCPAN